MIDVDVTSGMPTYTGFVTEFYMEGEASLPEGLTFNSTTGEIRGVPRATSMRQFTVCGANPAGEACTEITISVQNAYCEASDGFERTKVGETAVYECSMKGSYVGRQKRACVKGTNGGEWQKATGFCMSVVVIVLIVDIVIIVTVVVVFVLLLIAKRRRMAAWRRRS